MTSVSANENHLEAYSFVYGDEAVPYAVVRQAMGAGKDRKITIKVHPNGEVVVNAPEDADRQAIHEAVMKRARWIYNALNTFREHLRFVLPKTYVSGEMVFYLGRRYVLKVVEDGQAHPNVKMERGKLLVTLSHFDENKQAMTKALVSGWYAMRASQVFEERLSALLPQTTWVKSRPYFRTMPMQKQWGSCSARGNLMLNPHLVKAPKLCIDYVILHELCHIAEYNHSDRFWRLLTSVMPDWQMVKSRLDGMAELYLSE